MDKGKMIEQIQGYFVLTACFFLVFIFTFLLFERYKIIIHTFWGKQSWFWKIPWDPTRKIICLWAGILFSRKLTFYLPISGVIQTKYSVWCGHGYIIFLITLFFWISIEPIPLLYSKFYSKSKSRRKFGKYIPIFIGFAMFIGIFTFFIYTTIPFFSDEMSKISFGSFLILFFSVPLLMLKMVCQGEYLGFLTSLILACLTIYGYKKRKKISLRFKQLTILFFFVGVFILGIITCWGNCEQRFITKVQAAKTQSAFEELLEAAQSITGSYQSNALKHIAAAIAKTGDTRWAEIVASGIADEEIKNKALEEIREKIEEK